MLLLHPELDETSDDMLASWSDLPAVAMLVSDHLYPLVVDA